MGVLDYKDGGPAWRAWRDGVKANGGSPSTWPFRTGIYASHFGKAAARYDAAHYTALFNAGKIDLTAPTQIGAGNLVSVLASAEAIAQMPQSGLTTVQAVVNSAGTAIDTAAETLGLGEFAKYAKYAVIVLALVLAFSIFARIQRT